ncbi:hypothetical protein PHISP_04535 [Aspergillus sp. HF37]|nr:hypothetical protein PHISP_04535 [Aspergillus sp. HF37]
MNANKHYNEAKELCEALWPKTMFTPLVMFKWILNHCGRTIQDFIENPSFEDEHDKLIKAIEIAGEEELQPLWAGRTGVCTSWALLITTSLNGEYIYGAKDNHRAAWMANGVVVDSSARNALLLKEN